VVSHSVAVNNQWWWQLFPILEKHGFMVSRDHFSNAVNAKAAGKMEKAKAELQLVLESLVDAIREKDPQIKTLNPLFDGFDWHTSLQTLRTDLPDEEDWEFRFALTLLLIELLVKRFPRS
jgi:hypothetical protein